MTTIKVGNAPCLWGMLNIEGLAGLDRFAARQLATLGSIGL